MRVKTPKIPQAGKPWTETNNMNAKQAIAKLIEDCEEGEREPNGKEKCPMCDSKIGMDTKYCPKCKEVVR
jgi:hypothetical protein